MNKGVCVRLRPSKEASAHFRNKAAVADDVICEVAAVTKLGNCTLVLPQDVRIEGYSHLLPDGSGREYLDIHESHLEEVEAVNCPSCAGTGIYCGVCEPKGVGVICLTCNGEGLFPKDRLSSWDKPVPFTSRLQRTDVETVHWSWGSMPHISGPGGEGIPYEEFLAGKRPPPLEGTPDERISYFSSEKTSS